MRPAAASATSSGETHPCPFGSAQFHARDETAKIPIAGSRLREQHITPAIGRSDLRPDVRPQSEFLCSHVKTRRAVHAVTIEQRHGGDFAFGAHTRQFLGRRSAFEKAKCGARVQFDVAQS